MTDLRRLNRGRVVDTRPRHRWEIRRRFRRFRKKLGLNQAGLGSLIGLWQQSISEIETGRRRPHPRTWKQFEEVEWRHRQPKVKLLTRWN
jgi:DNA-binding XRE family transcriptional regulator